MFSSLLGDSSAGGSTTIENLYVATEPEPDLTFGNTETVPYDNEWAFGNAGTSDEPASLLPVGTPLGNDGSSGNGAIEVAGPGAFSINFGVLVQSDGSVTNRAVVVTWKGEGQCAFNPGDDTSCCDYVDYVDQEWVWIADQDDYACLEYLVDC